MPTFKLPYYSSTSREDLIERILQLEAGNGIRGFWAHPRYNLTGKENAFLGILASRTEVVSKDAIYTLLYGMDDDPPDPKILDVWVHKLRRKLRPLGVRIETIRGRGYFVDAEARQRIKAMQVVEAAERTAA